VLIVLAAWIPQGRTPPQALTGWQDYERYCLACHGAAGDGKGPAAPYTSARPRDLARGDFAWRTTKLGDAPTDDDLRLTLRFGAPGTSMPGFDGILTPAQLDDLVAVVKAFAPLRSAGAPVALAPPPAPNRERGAALWKTQGCITCHETQQRPWDLSRRPLHRPRADNDLRRAAAMSIATGLTGVMPSYSGALPDADIWALADHVVAINKPQPTHDMDAQRIADDKTPTAVWPGTDPDEAKLFGQLVPPQGPPPAALAPAQASLSARQCARCHAKQYREWETSLHRQAASPGLAAQMLGLGADEARGCVRCHTPLAEQRTDDALRAQGLSCGGCHVRGWTRHGPPNVAPTLLAIPSYPLVTLGIYERSDFCLPCHQLPPRGAVAGRPLLDTYREWLEGPYMRRGVQCQHCHMANREHQWLGVHDAHTFRQSIALTLSARSIGGTVTATAELSNIGAGHFLPTTPTPAAWLWLELLDAKGKPIAGANASQRIGRDIYFDGTWHERADTRIPPGERLTLTRAWKADAASLRVTVEVHPDDYYEHLYQQRLKQKLSDERRALYQQALARATAAHYVAEQRTVPIAR
jgi:mono/diheme cytochrome c family protein